METFKIKSFIKGSNSYFDLSIIKNKTCIYYFYNNQFHKFGYRNDYHLFGSFNIRLVKDEMIPTNDLELKNKFIEFSKSLSRVKKRAILENNTFFKITAKKTKVENSGTDPYSFAVESIGINVDFQVTETITIIAKNKVNEYISFYKKLGFSVKKIKLVKSDLSEYVNYSHYDNVEGETGFLLPEKYKLS